MSETTFVREKKERNYTVVDNTYIKDNSLSWKAKGLFTYLLSLPEDWKIYMSEIVKHSPGGMDELRTIIKELQEHGYISHEAKRDESGRMNGWTYKIKEIPVIDTPIRENTDIGKHRYRENPTLLNTDSVVNTDSNSNCENKFSLISDHKETKKEKKEMYPREVYKEIIETYKQEYINKNGEEPIFLYPSACNMIKKWLNNKVTKEQIIKAIKNSKDDEWVSEKGMTLNIILSNNVFPRLVNTQFKNSSFPKKNNSAPGGLRVFARDTQLDMEEVK